MSGGDFQPCAVGDDAAAPAPGWERKLVALSLVVHTADIGLDLLVLRAFLVHYRLGFCLGVAGIIVWAWLVSSVYVSFGGQAEGDGDIDGHRLGGPLSKVQRFLLNFAQVQIFVEAFECMYRGGDTDFFYTLRLMESILESAPSALWKLYALVIWDDAPWGVQFLLSQSILFSFVSVGMGLAMWEQKVQFRTTSLYIASVAVMRFFEVASRSMTIAIFGAVTLPYGGFWWSLLIDYSIVMFLLVRHQSLKFTYGLFVAMPLVLVSLEPMVWRWEDHAVPKDSYYLVRILEFVVMWMVIIQRQDSLPAVADSGGFDGSYLACEALALLATLGLYVMLPLVWRVARRFELSREVVTWGDDGRCDGFNGSSDGYYDSDNEGRDSSDEDDERTGVLRREALPPE